jgi:type I restriction enzyme S subunit
MVCLGDLMAAKKTSLDPRKTPDEVFDLFSIPAFDAGKPEVLRGTEIGSAKQALLPGDVLLSKIVPHIRRACVVPSTTTRRMIGSSEWIIFRSHRFDPAYLRHALVSDQVHRAFMQTVAGVGGSLLRARPSYVAEIEIPLPPLEEQRRIASILDAADALRTKRRHSLAKLDTLTQAIFIDMFGDPSQPNGQTCRLTDLAELQVGYPFKSSTFTEDQSGVRICRGVNVAPGEISWKDTARVPSEIAEAFADYELTLGDVVVAMDRPWIGSGFKVAKVTGSAVGSLLVQRVARLRAIGDTPAEYVYQLLRMPAFSQHCSPTETTIPHISPNDFRSFDVSKPSRDRLRDFESASSIATMTRERLAVSAELHEQLFASLQHRAFRGEL